MNPARRPERAIGGDVDDVDVVGALIGGDEAEPVPGAAGGQAEGRIRRHARRDAHSGAALEWDPHEMAELVAAGVVVIVDEAAVGPQDAGHHPGGTARQRPEPPGRQVPSVQLERAGHVAGDETTRGSAGGDLHAADERHAEARFPGRRGVRHGSS